MGFLSSVAWTIHQVSIVWLDLFLRNRFFVVPEFLGNLLRDFPKESLFLISNSLHELIFFSLCLICPLIRPVQLKSLRFKISIVFHRWQYQHFFVLNFECPCLLQPQVIVSALCILLEHQFSFLFQVDMQISPFRQSLSPFQISISFLSRQSPFNTCN